MLRTLTYRILSATDGQTILHYLKSLGYSGPIVAFRAKCKMFSRHLQKPILKTEKGRFKGL